MKTNLKLLILAVIFSTGLIAQETTPPPADYKAPGDVNYRNAVGIRMGVTSGLTYKHMFNRGNAFEGIISTWPYALGATALFEKHKGTNTAGLQFYYGAGGHVNVGSTYRRVYYYRDYYDNRRYTYVYSSGGSAVGIDGILGLEYKFRPVPLAISADIKPFSEINNYGDVYIAIDPSIGLKLTF